MQRRFTLISPKKKYLIDSNTYFRLGDNLCPLFPKIITLGKESFCACILGGTFQEYLYQPRLQSKFDWVFNTRHVADRKQGKLRIQKHEASSIKGKKEFVYEGSKDMGLGCSPFDVECLVTAMEKKLALVTDDLDLVRLAKEYDCPVLSSIQLLGLLYESSQISKQDIVDTIDIWIWLEDVPSQWQKDYASVFGEKYPPTMKGDSD